MSAPSITISHLAWSARGGRALFSDLNLIFGPERVGVVGRNGVGKTTLLRLISGELEPQAGAIAVDGRLAALRQTVQVDPDETIADLFGVAPALAQLARAAAGEADADDLAGADWTLETRMAAALARMELAAEPQTRLATLSGGQRTRAALAALVFSEPDFLILDEPTNNLDHDGRAVVAELLDGWTAGALVVSHDRDLLEGMDGIVELTSLGAARYGGGWSAYRARKAAELASAEHALSEAERRITEVAREAQAQAERKARKDRAGRKKAAKGDMPNMLANARRERAEATGADQTTLAENRMSDASAELATARGRIEVVAPLSLGLPSTGLAAGKEVLRLNQVTAGYAPDRPVLGPLDLEITGPERIAVTGPNGAGKSTLLAVIVGDLPALSGRVRRGAAAALFDQGVSLLDPAQPILENFRRLNPDAVDNACRAALARFGFRADAALQIAGALSGGQLLRAGLACVLGGPRPPALLVLDEPTNHLDVESVEAVEAGLAAYDGALIVVSHDERFLANIGVARRVKLAKGVAFDT
jgi:ATPase subunit of ABC transporter with duplicated ATPase domains